MYRFKIYSQMARRPMTSPLLTSRDQKILIYLSKFQNVGRPTELLRRRFAGSDCDQLTSIQEKLLDLKLISIENGKWLLTALGRVYVDAASTTRYRPYYFLCLIICASVLSLLVYRVLLAP